MASYYCNIYNTYGETGDGSEPEPYNWAQFLSAIESSSGDTFLLHGVRVIESGPLALASGANNSVVALDETEPWVIFHNVSGENAIWGATSVTPPVLTSGGIIESAGFFSWGNALVNNARVVSNMYVKGAQSMYFAGHSNGSITFNGCTLITDSSDQFRINEFESESTVFTANDSVFVYPGTFEYPDGASPAYNSCVFTGDSNSVLVPA